MAKQSNYKGGTEMKIYKIRNSLYKTSRLLGDYSAVKNGRVLKRAKNRLVGRWLNKLMRW